jgi:hypothetical protein
MNNRLKKDGEIHGMAMTPYYNPDKRVTDKLRPGAPPPAILNEEWERQIFERLQDLDLVFPGYPGIQHPDICPLTNHIINLIDQKVLTRIIEATSLKVNHFIEFSLIDENFYSSDRRWLAFVLSKGQPVDLAVFGELHSRAQSGETKDVSLYKNYLFCSLENPSEPFRKWFSYLNTCGVSSASNLILVEDKLGTKKGPFWPSYGW